ncbi:MAG TPA: dephospho-CoA kinase [Caulobacterales bacterium]|nr:dephospho-CoA kinase [Caulobacterales bacterium]
MIVVGLTGSIGMGKSTVARMFAEEGAPVFDADAAVHEFYAPGGAAVAPIQAAFPGVVEDGAINRDLLSARIVGNPEALRRLEAVVHPLVRTAQARFLRAQRAARAPLAVLDVPLLFETGAASRFDKIVVVSAPAEVQRARVMARPGMTEAKFAAIRTRQTPDAKKRADADFVIETGGDLEQTRAQVRAVLDALRKAA